MVDRHSAERATQPEARFSASAGGSGRIMDEQTSVAAEDPQDEGSVVRAALAGLPERDREVLMLAVWDDLDREAIAEVLGCSKANVSLRLHRARRHFAEALKGRAATPDP